MSDTEIKTADTIMGKFIQSMNEFTHNGTVHDYDHARALELARHYILQCPLDQRAELACQLAAALSARYHYQITEQGLNFGSSFENRIREKISLWVKTHYKDPVKMIGFMIQGSFNFTSRLFKSFIEPAVTQTALSYSLILNPAVIPLNRDFKAESENSVQETIAAPKNEFVRQAGRVYTELEFVNWYSEALVEEIGRNHSDRDHLRMKSALKRNPVPARDETTIQDNFEGPKTFGRLNLNIERRRMEPALDMTKAKAATVQSASTRPVRELRPNAEIHAVLMGNDYKFQNCIRPYRSELQTRERRISVRFDITPAGSVTNISISKKMGKEDIVQRLKLQLMQLRFSKVDLRFGDQTVYHTFFL